MEPIVLRINASVEIAVPPATLFAFVADASAKARLNPAVHVIRIERETPGPLQEGTVTFFRLQKGKRIFEYRSRCIRFEPDRFVESQADLPTLFRVRVRVEPNGHGGARLTQEEECEVTGAMVEGLPLSGQAERAWRAIKVLHYVFPALARETYFVMLRERAEGLRDELERELRAHLQCVKAHLEAGARQ